MLRPGTVLLNPASGQRLIVRRTARETRGRLLELERFYPPRGPQPPDHVHPEQEELFEVMAGSLWARVSGREQHLDPGDVLTISAGTPHSLWNAEPVEAHVVWHTYPALDTEVLVETLWALGQAGKTDRRGMPNPLQMAVLLRAYQREVRLAQQPGVLKRAFLLALALLGSASGYPRHLAYNQVTAERNTG
jgi:quercetin dioxygenase-like cupin family protein